MAAIDVWEWFVSFFRRKRLLIVYMITVDGDISICRKNIKENKFEYKNGFYVVTKERVYYNKKTQKAVSFYFEGNPEPLNLTHTKHIAMSAEALKEVIKSDMIKDSFSTEKNNETIILIIILCIIALMVLVNLLVAFKVIQVK
jgi:hypothetical protein